MEVASAATNAKVERARAAGDVNGMIGDTGLNAVAMVLGWIPGAILVGIMVALKESWFHPKNLKKWFTLEGYLEEPKKTDGGK